MNKIILILFVLLSFGVKAQVQEPLEDLNNFKPQAGNWQIVSEVTMDRNYDSHTSEKETSKKKRKRKKREKNTEEPITFSPGTGILLNLPSEDKKDALITNWEHGDLKLELEVMLPKGSNSGIFLQGRYEVQLYDSWGVKNPSFTDIGGIYRNWEKDPTLSFAGVPPISNAAKAPGLWQKLYIHFQAPRFDEDGKKISHAKFVLVKLNDVVIHSNVEVPTYTGGQISKQEAATGPLMIQGDHGAVAFRNIKYRILEPPTITLQNLNYVSYNQKIGSLEEVATKTPTDEGVAKEIDVLLTGKDDNYGIVFKGELNVETEDVYDISIGFSGGVLFELEGNTLIKYNATSMQHEQTVQVKLKKGNHPFKLTNIKAAGWHAPRLGMTITTPTTNPKHFHNYESYPPSVLGVAPIFVDAKAQPRMLRAFVNFRNKERLSHTIGVATPNKLNYVYNLKTASIIGVWRGDFVDATPMWHDRGNGSFNPRGAVQWTFLDQPLAKLDNMDQTFPGKEGSDDLLPKGYTIDPKTKLPIFKFVYKGIKATQSIWPSSKNTHWISEITFSEQNMLNEYFKLAEGKIKKLKDGSYAIDDFQYYIKMKSAQIPEIRTINEHQELIIPLDGNTITYEIIW